MKSQPPSKQEEDPLRPSSKDNKVRKRDPARRSKDAHYGASRKETIAEEDSALPENLDRNSPGSYAEGQPYTFGAAQHAQWPQADNSELCQHESRDEIETADDILLLELRTTEEGTELQYERPTWRLRSRSRTFVPSRQQDLVTDVTPGIAAEILYRQQFEGRRADVNDENEDEHMEDVGAPRFVCFNRYVHPLDGVLMDNGDGIVMPREQDLGMTTSRQHDYDFGFRERRTTPTFSQPIPAGLSARASETNTRHEEDESSVGATQYHVPAHQRISMNLALTGQHPQIQPYQMGNSHAAVEGVTLASGVAPRVAPPAMPQQLLDSGQSVAKSLNIAESVQNSTDSWLLNSPAAPSVQVGGRAARLQAIQAGNHQQTGNVGLW